MPAIAVDVRVISAEAVRDVLEAVGKECAPKAGIRFSFTFVTAGQVRDAVVSGEPVDVAIASNAVMAELRQAEKISESVDLGRIGMAVAIREGASPPDISTPEAFTRTMLAAKAVSYTNPAAGGTAGIYFAGLLRKLGIADEVNSRAVLSNGGRDAAERVARGEAEFGITFPSEINPIEGARVGGMLPEALQNYVIYSATIPPASRNPGSARAYLTALTAPAARPYWSGAGFEQLGAR